MRLCDICGKREAVRFDRIIENNFATDYAYCDECYTRALKGGAIPCELAKVRLMRRGLECDACGCTAEAFERDFLMGCPDCYRNMRGVALKAAAEYAKSAAGADRVPYVVCDQKELSLISLNVVSSRVRLARNVEGMPFPRNIKVADERLVRLFNGALKATEGVFDGELYPMNSLSKLKKKALVELHAISLPLANNDLGAVIVDRTGEMSVMLNEEDHIREQCVLDGFCLGDAYGRVKRYDDSLKRILPIAYDRQMGYLTACPSNLGTGMRASVMLFLPALKRTGAIENAFSLYKSRYGLTVRGYFGEGSDSAYDMYQLSNGRTFMTDEQSILRDVTNAAIALCRLEREALTMVVQKEKTPLIDKIFRSYGVLTSAFSLSAEELMERLVDVKLGVILGVLPIKRMKELNSLIGACASSFEILTDGKTDEERNIARANIVRECLAEVQ